MEFKTVQNVLRRGLVGNQKELLSETLLNRSKTPSPKRPFRHYVSRGDRSPLVLILWNNSHRNPMKGIVVELTQFLVELPYQISTGNHLFCHKHLQNETLTCRVRHLKRGGASLVVDRAEDARVIHWGEPDTPSRTATAGFDHSDLAGLGSVSAVRACDARPLRIFCGPLWRMFGK
jgi:hypothetical protein